MKKPNYLAVWIFLLMSANHEDTSIIWNRKKTLIKKGSFIGSLRKISDHFGIGIATVKYIIDYFVSEQMIEHSPTKKFSVFTILNWSKYQGIEHLIEHKVKSKRNQSETNKNDKNVKNDKNISKEIQKAPFGNEDINKLTELLQNLIGGSLDGTQRENRNYAHLLIARFKKDFPNRNPVELIGMVMDRGVADRFHAKNLTNFKYLYYNAQKIIQSAKSDLTKNRITKIS